MSQGSPDVTIDIDTGAEIHAGAGEIVLNGSSDVIVAMDDGAEIHAGPGEIELNSTRRTNGTSVTSSREGSTMVNFPIAMVREPFRSLAGNSYTPDCVPIGPYHANRSSPWIEQLKVNSVKYMENRAGGGLARLVDELQPQAMQHYRDGVEREKLSRVLLRDGCFLLACAVHYDATPTGNPPAPAASATSSNSHHISSDTLARDTVFLLENQIPFFVLDSIHQRVRVRQAGAPPLLQAIEPYLQNLLHESRYVSQHEPPSLPEPSHLLHLVHFYFKPPSQSQIVHAKKKLFNRRPPNDAGLSTGRWRRATEYCKYGNVRFKCRVFDGDERWSILDVRLEGGALLIPRLRVDSMTWTVLRNLMALEEHMPAGRPVTAYCIFMSQLASKVEDVEILQRQGILEQFLATDEDVARGFADLCKGVVMDVDKLERNYLRPIWHQLHDRCHYRSNNTIGSFRQKYCSDPMYVAGFVVAAFLFIFGLAQAILGLISVLQQSKH